MSWVCKIKGHRLSPVSVKFRKSEKLKLFYCTRCKNNYGQFTSDGPLILFDQLLLDTWGAYRPASSALLISTNECQN